MAEIVALDGPSGVGKGTMASRLARTLGWHLLDSGALYRVLAYGAGREGVPLDDAAGLAGLALRLPVQFREESPGDVRVFFEEQDVTSDIRTETAGADASHVAAILEVRKALLQRQRDFCQPPGLVADGRDMGTVVFPDAPVKIFLDASPEVRAERRYKQLKDKGLDVTLSDLLEEIAARDARDRTRTVAPLRPAEDAIVIDTSELGVEEVFKRVMAVVNDRLKLQ